MGEGKGGLQLEQYFVLEPHLMIAPYCQPSTLTAYHNRIRRSPAVFPSWSFQWWPSNNDRLSLADVSRLPVNVELTAPLSSPLNRSASLMGTDFT